MDGEDRILGIVHDRDLLQHLARQNAPGIMARLIGFLSQPRAGFDVPSGTARDVMTTRVITVPEHMPLPDVIQILLENRIKRVAVADESGRLVGMVDRDTVLKGLAG